MSFVHIAIVDNYLFDYIIEQIKTGYLLNDYFKIEANAEKCQLGFLSEYFWQKSTGRTSNTRPSYQRPRL